MSLHSRPNSPLPPAATNAVLLPPLTSSSIATMTDHSSNSLYCNEELSDADSPTSPQPPTYYPETASESDDSSLIARLLDSECHHMPGQDYLRLCHSRPNHLTSRQSSVNYILKVHAAYRFKPVTAFLSVNYFDRFLSSHTLPESGWPFQLLSVACLSLAAKMEEMYVPLLMDLQISEPTYIFGPKTVQRMELCVMATLDWRLRSVTPFDYLHYFTSKLPSSSAESKFDSITSLASDLILNSTRVIDFVTFPPSVMAVAALISAAGESLSPSETLHESVDREMVTSCHQLMDQYLVDTCTTGHLMIQRAPPPSPIGVLDAAARASYDTCSENHAIGSGIASGSVADGTAERGMKRQRSSASGVHEP
ncbi:cyclin-D1-1-like [Primulina eburnea]|uniref:cyclin-D1-1-like n=1 Tax=Primulina eburnea TaxID=1245227 RepID=UPI003C6C28B0